MYFILASQPLLSFFVYVSGRYCEKILEKGTLEETEVAGRGRERRKKGGESWTGGSGSCCFLCWLAAVG